MKVALLRLWLCVGTIPALAQNNQGHNNGNQGQNQQGESDPLIGFGVPVALAVAGVLIGAKFLNRKR